MTILHAFTNQYQFQAWLALCILGSADVTILHAFTNQYQFQKRFQFKPASVQRKVGAPPDTDGAC